MYVIRRNHHYYNRTKIDMFKDKWVPSVRHVYVPHIEDGAQFDSKDEAYRVAEQVGGTHIEYVEKKRSVTQLNLLYQLPRDRFLMTVLPMLLQYVTRQTLADKIHISHSTLTKLLEGNYINVSPNVRQRVHQVLLLAPLDERFIDWECHYYITDSAEREARWIQLRPLLIDCKEVYEYSLLRMEEAFHVGRGIINTILRGKYVPGALLLRKLEEGLREHGYDVDNIEEELTRLMGKENEHE